MLRRPLSPCRKMSYPINSRISRKAESGEHFASLAYLPLVSFPLNLVNRRLMITRWRLRPASFQQRLPRFCSGHQAGPMSIPSLRASEERTGATSRDSPSITLEFTASGGKISKPASSARRSQGLASAFGADPACGAWRQAVPPALQWPTGMMVSPAAFREYSAESPHFCCGGIKMHDDFDNASAMPSVR